MGNRRTTHISYDKERSMIIDSNQVNDVAARARDLIEQRYH
jgi:hypothetical protein